MNREVAAILSIFVGLLFLVYSVWPQQPSSKSVGQNQEMNAFRAVFVTVPNIEVGKKIAQ